MSETQNLIILTPTEVEIFIWIMSPLRSKKTSVAAADERNIIILHRKITDNLNLAAKYLKIQFTRVQGQVFYTTIPCFTIKTKLRHLKSIQMIYTVFLNCKQLVLGLNKYQNKLFASRIHLYVIYVIYVTCAATPYRIIYV